MKSMTAYLLNGTAIILVLGSKIIGKIIALFIKIVCSLGKKNAFSESLITGSSTWSGLSLGAGDQRNSPPIPPLIAGYPKKMIKLKKNSH
jgi:hypothetical protein